MSKIGGIIVVIVSLLAGFGGGFLYEATLGKTTATKATTGGASSTAEKSTDTKQTLAECLTDVWGEDKYAAISANSSLATTEDNLAALKCYE